MVKWEPENLRLREKLYYLFGRIRVWKKNYGLRAIEEKNGWVGE